MAKKFITDYDEFIITIMDEVQAGVTYRLDTEVGLGTRDRGDPGFYNCTEKQRLFQQSNDVPVVQYFKKGLYFDTAQEAADHEQEVLGFTIDRLVKEAEIANMKLKHQNLRNLTFERQE